MITTESWAWASTSVSRSLNGRNARLRKLITDQALESPFTRKPCTRSPDPDATLANDRAGMRYFSLGDSPSKRFSLGFSLPCRFSDVFISGCYWFSPCRSKICHRAG